MEQIQIHIIDANGNVLAENTGNKEVFLVYNNEYREGDCIVVEFPKVPAYYLIQLDDAREPALSYVTGKVTYQIPFGEKRISMSPKAFTGNLHLLHVRKAYDFEINSYRNLAFQPYDQHGQSTLFPHAYANVETRGESVFAAANAIDGCVITNSHGAWPYQSWGINKDPNAEMILNFGRNVVADRIVIYTRADYPHDAWWEKATIEFSDGSELILNLIKTGEAQCFTFEKKEIQWLKLKNLIKANDPSPFPALTQIEVYGF